MQYRNYSNGKNYFWIGILLLFLFGGWRLILLLFGLAFGLIISFFPLIIVGTLAYSVLKSIRHNSQINSGIRSTSPSHQKFTELLIRIIAHVINSDNHIDDKEISVVIQCFARIGFPQHRMAWLVDLLQSALKQNPPLDQLCAEFNQRFQYQSKLILLDMLYQVALADHTLSSDELSMIQTIGEYLYIDPSDQASMQYQYASYQTKTGQSQSRGNHQSTATKYQHYLKILGLSGNPDQTTIKAAYKTACKKYHPDKVQHLGAEYQAVANEKIRTITEAYQYLKTQS